MKKQDLVEFVLIITPGILGGLLINKFIVEKLSNQLNLDVLLVTVFLTIPLFALSSFLKGSSQTKPN